jgi:hypothetical protein
MKESSGMCGFGMHGFHPRGNSARGCNFVPLCAHQPITDIDFGRMVPVQRGFWQQPPAAGLRNLSVGDRVRFCYCVMRQRESRRAPDRAEKEGVLGEIPKATNHGVFVFEDGFVIGADRVKELVVLP